MEHATRNNTVVVSKRVMLFLGLPVLVPSSGVASMAVMQYMVSVERLGEALDVALTEYLSVYGVGGGDVGESHLEPVDISVLRSRLVDIAAKLRREYLSAFTAVESDMIEVITPGERLGEHGALEPACRPAWFEFVLFGMLVAADGTLALLAVLELLMWPRLTPEQRLNPVSNDGAFMRLHDLCRKGMDAEEFTIVDDLPQEERAVEFVGWLASFLPPSPQLTTYWPSVAATAMGLLRVAKAMASSGGATAVSAHNVLCAVQHYKTLSGIVGAEMTGGAALGVLGDLARVALKAESRPLDLGKLAQTEGLILHLEAVLAEAEADGAPAERKVALVTLHLTEAREEMAAAPRSTGGGGGDAAHSGEGGAGGYTVAHQRGLREHITTSEFLRVQSSLQALFDADAEPLRMILLIFQSREAIFIHALLGRIKFLPAVPLVSTISRRLRPKGPQALSDLFVERAMPEEVQGKVRRLRASPATVEWALLEAGSLAFDYENIHVRSRAEAGANSSNGKWVKVPPGTEYAHSSRLSNSTTPFVVQLLEDLGYPANLGARADGTVRSAASLFASLKLYVTHAAASNPKHAMQVQRSTVMGWLQELSGEFKAFLMGGDPTDYLPREAVGVHSAVMEHLMGLRQDVAPSNELGRVLRMAVGEQAASRLGFSNPLLPEGVAASDVAAVVQGVGAQAAKAAAGMTQQAATPADEPAPSPDNSDRADALAGLTGEKLKAMTLQLDQLESSRVKVGAWADSTPGSSSKLARLVKPGSGEKRDGLELGKAGTTQLRFVDRHSFEKVAPKGACIASYCCKSSVNPHGLCCECDEVGHERPTSVAHRVPMGWRRRNLKDLLMVVALATMPGSVAPAAVPRVGVAALAACGGELRASAPSLRETVSATVRVPGVDVSAGTEFAVAGTSGLSELVAAGPWSAVLAEREKGERLHSIGEVSRAQVAAEERGDLASVAELELRLRQLREAGADAPSERSGASWAKAIEFEEVRAHVYIPVWFATDAAPFIAVPPGVADAFFGSLSTEFRGPVSGAVREAALDQAWSFNTTCFGGRDDLVAFGLFEDDERASSQVTGFVASSPLPPHAPERAVCTRRALARMTGSAPVWVSLKALRGSPCERLAMLAVARAASFCWPTREFSTLGAKVGAVGPVAVVTPEPTGGLAAKCTQMTAAEVRGQANAAVARLQSHFTWLLDGGGGLSKEALQAIAKWRPVARPVQWGDITPGALALATRIDYAGVRVCPWPSAVRPVSSKAPPGLPGPPPANLVPASARSWADVLRPDSHQLVLDWLRQLRVAFVAFIGGATGDALWRLLPKSLALTFDSFEPWVGACVKAGHVVVRKGNGFELQDLSAPPATHLNRTVTSTSKLGLHELLDDNGSTDGALRDALTNGVTYMSGRHPKDETDAVLLLQPNLRSMFVDRDGFIRAHAAVTKYAARGWFELINMPGLDAGVIEIPSIPWRVNAYGLVVKGNGVDYRGICDYGAPHNDLRLTVWCWVDDAGEVLSELEARRRKLAIAVARAAEVAPKAKGATLPCGGLIGCSAALAVGSVPLVVASAKPRPLVASATRAAAQAAAPTKVPLILRGHSIHRDRPNSIHFDRPKLGGTVSGEEAAALCDARSLNGGVRLPDATWRLAATGALVPSLNASCGLHASKAVRRDAKQKGRRAGIRLRNCPALRRGHEEKGERDLWEAGPQTSTACRLDWEGWLFCSELKPYFIDLLLAVAIMSHLGELAGLDVIVVTDDCEAMFHQFALAAHQEWQCGGLRLDPVALAAGDADAMIEAALCAVRERCMAMGVASSSNWAQRALTEVTTYLTRKFSEAEEPFWSELEARHPGFRECRERRRALSAQTGRDEARCFFCFGYTDDLIALCLGVEAAARYVILHEEVLGPRGINLLMAPEEKRSMGVSASFIGGNVLTAGAIGYVTPAKVHSTLGRLAAAVEGVLILSEYVRLVGMLNHLVILLSLPYTEMYAIYEISDASRDAGIGLDERIVLTHNGVASLERFKERLLQTAGVSALAAVCPVIPGNPDEIVCVMHSDAAIKGTGAPALCGNLYERVWVIPLKGTKYLCLPIVVLEFLCAPINLHCFAEHLHGRRAALEIDALVVPLVLGGKASTPMMRFLHAALVNDASYQLVADLLSAQHGYGPYNPLADAYSRGKFDLGDKLMRHMGFTPCWVTPPQRSFDLLDEAVSVWRAMTDEERQTTRSRLNTASSGPSPYVYESETDEASGATGADPALVAVAITVVAAAALVAGGERTGRGRGRGAATAETRLEDNPGAGALTTGWTVQPRYGGHRVDDLLRMGPGQMRAAAADWDFRTVLRLASMLNELDPEGAALDPRTPAGLLRVHVAQRFRVLFDPSQRVAQERLRRVGDQSRTERAEGSAALGGDEAAARADEAVQVRPQLQQLPRGGRGASRTRSNLGGIARGRGGIARGRGVVAAHLLRAAAEGGHEERARVDDFYGALEEVDRRPPEEPAERDDEARGRPPRAAAAMARVRAASALAGGEREHDAASEAAADERARRKACGERRRLHEARMTACSELEARRAVSDPEITTVEAVDFTAWRRASVSVGAVVLDAVEAVQERGASAPPERAAPGRVLAGSAPVKQTRRRRCGDCEGCNAAPCGSCAPCLDKPARGGPGTLRKACSARTCLSLGLLFWAPQPGATMRLSRPFGAALGPHYSSNVAGDGAAGGWRLPQGLAIDVGAAPTAWTPGGLETGWRAPGTAATAAVITPAAREQGRGWRLPPPLAGLGVSALPSLEWPERFGPAAERLSATAARELRPLNGAGAAARGVTLRELAQLGCAAPARLERIAAGLAILPDAPEEHEARRARMAEVMRKGYAPSTVEKDMSHFRAWTAICERLGTSPWRTDVAANSGLDSEGHAEEIELMVHALIIFARELKPRSNKHTQAQPASGKKKIEAVARVHWYEKGIRMAPISAASLAVKGLMREYIDEHGLEGLIPDRKNPLSNELIDGMLATPNLTKSGSLQVQWDSYKWTALRALFSLLAESGERKDEVAKAKASTPFRKGRLSLASLAFKIGGNVSSAIPSAARLRSMGPGDGLLLAHGVAKNDPFGQYFAATPTFLPWRGEGRCACRAIVNLLTHPDGVIDEHLRDTTPLFGPTSGAEFTHAEVDAAFRLLLANGGGVPSNEMSHYSVHSFRIFCCCALLNADCPRWLIKRMLRWRGDESMEVYGRTDDAEWSKWLDRALRAKVDSTVVGNYPQIDVSPEQRRAFLDVARSLLLPSAAA